MSKLFGPLHSLVCKAAVVLICLLTLVTACNPASTPVYFVPPTQFVEITSTQFVVRIPTQTAPAPTQASTPPAPCTDGLTFVQDVTVVDNTPFGPGALIEKQWLVTNSGTCDWDAQFHFKLIDGPAMGAATDQALYPARAGRQATLRIIFTAPADTGTYKSTWQAFGPNGAAFGDPIYIQIVVQ